MSVGADDITASMLQINCDASVVRAAISSSPSSAHGRRTRLVEMSVARLTELFCGNGKP
jgi:hypothetical protein